MDFDSTSDAADLLAAQERREPQKQRIIGHLVSLTGMHGLIACEMTPEEGGDHWSVGSLISVVHANSRLVGVVCELATSNSRWHESERNLALIKIELSGEIIDEAPGKPVFHRGIHSFPALGSIAHRIRASDLRAIYSIRGALGVEIGRLTQNETIPATVNVEELVTRHFAVVGSTGVGKTTAVSMLLKTCLRERPNLRVMIVDPHNEYAAHFSRGFGRARLRTTSNFRIGCSSSRRWSTSSTPAASPIPTKAMRSTRSSSRQDPVQRRLPPPRARVAFAASPNAENGWVSADTPVPYRISDAVQVIDEWMGKLESRYARADLRALKHRLETLSHDPRFRFMFGKLMVEDNMAKVIARFSACRRRGAGDDRAARGPAERGRQFASFRCWRAWPSRSRCGATATYEIVLLCEEAHRYIPADQSQGVRPDPPGDRPHCQGGAQIRRLRSASSPSVPPSSTRPCSRSARRCSRCAWPTSGTRRSSARRSASLPRARSAFSPRSPTARRSPSAKRSRRRCE